MLHLYICVCFYYYKYIQYSSMVLLSADVSSEKQLFVLLRRDKTSNICLSIQCVGLKQNVLNSIDALVSRVSINLTFCSIVSNTLSQNLTKYSHNKLSLSRMGYIWICTVHCAYTVSLVYWPDIISENPDIPRQVRFLCVALDYFGIKCYSFWRCKCRIKGFSSRSQEGISRVPVVRAIED